MESSTDILSHSLFWKQNKLSVVIQTISWRANLRPALGHGCGRQTPSARNLFFWANLLYVPNIKMQKIMIVGSRSVHDFGTFKESAVAQCRLPIFKRVWPQDSSEIRHCAAAFFLQVPKSCTDLDLTLLYISIRGIYSKKIYQVYSFLFFNNSCWAGWTRFFAQISS